MGELVESKQLSLKDLGYGIEAAWDDKVKQTAIALALMRLEQVVKEPSGRTGLVHLVPGGRSYAERQQLWLTFLYGLTVRVHIFLFFPCVAIESGSHHCTSGSQINSPIHFFPIKSHLIHIYSWNIRPWHVVHCIFA